MKFSLLFRLCNYILHTDFVYCPRHWRGLLYYQHLLLLKFMMWYPFASLTSTHMRATLRYARHVRGILLFINWGEPQVD